MTERHVERYDFAPRPGTDTSVWPYTVPAVARLLRDGGFEVPAGVTFLVGENGSGKSTLVEALARAYPRRGVENPFVNLTGDQGSAEDAPLWRDLRARTHPLASPAGYFLRAETMHRVLAAAESPEQRRAWGGELVQRQSHGESFLAVLRHRFDQVGVYFLDEPEAALSFTSCLGLVALLDQLRREGSQVVCATHSPLLASLPGATLLEVGEWGLREVTYDDLDLVRSWRDFLAAPSRYLRYLLDD